MVNEFVWYLTVPLKITEIFFSAMQVLVFKCKIFEKGVHSMHENLEGN